VIQIRFWVLGPTVAGFEMMHRVLAALFVASIAEPGFAQTILEHEPLYLAPYETAYVYNASCGLGMALKVTGSIRSLPRKKVCVPSTLEQASLLGVAPFHDPVGRAP
jgi:hypothetical protein